MEICAFDRGAECGALRDKTCTGCSFHKTAKELREGRKRATEHIRTLPTEHQVYIFDKYHKRGMRSNDTEIID